MFAKLNSNLVKADGCSLWIPNAFVMPTTMSCDSISHELVLCHLGTESGIHLASRPSFSLVSGCSVRVIEIRFLVPAISIVLEQVSFQEPFRNCKYILSGTPEVQAFLDYIQAGSAGASERGCLPSRVCLPLTIIEQVRCI